MDFNNDCGSIAESLTITQKVTDDMLECSIGCGNTHTLSLSSIISIMEKAAFQLAERHLSQGSTTVGAMMNITHTAPTVSGVEIYVTAELLEMSHGQLYFEITARDNMGIIGEATHQRVAVPLEMYDEKAQMRSGFYERKRR